MAGNDSHVNIPIPDPSSLTTAAVDREIRHLRELYDRAEASLRELYDQKFKMVQIQIEAERRAVTLALAAVTASDQTKEVRIAEMKERLDRGDGKSAGFSGAGALMATLVGVVSAVVGIAGALFVLKP